MTGDTLPLPRPLTIADLRGLQRAAVEFPAPLQQHFEDFARALAGELGALAGMTPDLAVDTVEPPRNRADIFAEEAHWMCCRWVAEPGGFDLVVRADQAFLYTLCDLAFGGGGSAEAYSAERGRSRIEQGIADLLFAAIGRRLPSAFPVQAAGLAFTADPGAREPLQPVAAEVTLLLSVLGFGGEMVIGLPKPALALFRETAKATSSEADFTPHQEWGARIHASLGGADLTLRAILCEQEISLAGIARFEPGMTIEIPVRLETPLKVYCEDRHLLDATFARSEQTVSLLVDRLVPQP